MKTTLTMKLDFILMLGTIGYTNEGTSWTDDERKEFINKGWKSYKFTAFDTESDNDIIQFCKTSAIFVNTVYNFFKK